MADIKQLYTLNTDDEFTRLSFPLSRHDMKVLEDDIIKNGCNTPIRVWNSYVVIMKNMKYVINTKFHFR